MYGPCQSGRLAVFAGPVAQKSQLFRSEHQVRIVVPQPPSRQRQHHQPPRNHRVPLKVRGGADHHPLHVAPRLQHADEICARPPGASPGPAARAWPCDRSARSSPTAGSFPTGPPPRTSPPATGGTRSAPRNPPANGAAPASKSGTDSARPPGLGTPAATPRPSPSSAPAAPAAKPPPRTPVRPASREPSPPIRG